MMMVGRETSLFLDIIPHFIRAVRRYLQCSHPFPLFEDWWLRPVVVTAQLRSWIVPPITNCQYNGRDHLGFVRSMDVLVSQSIGAVVADIGGLAQLHFMCERIIPCGTHIICKIFHGNMKSCRYSSNALQRRSFNS